MILRDSSNQFLKSFFLIINPGTDITYYLKWLSFCQKICLNMINLSFQIIFLFIAGNATISNCNAFFRLYIYYLVELLIRIISIIYPLFNLCTLGIFHLHRLSLQLF